MNTAYNMGININSHKNVDKNTSWSVLGRNSIDIIQQGTEMSSFSRRQKSAQIKLTRGLDVWSTTTERAHWSTNRRRTANWTDWNWHFGYARDSSYPSADLGAMAGTHVNGSYRLSISVWAGYVVFKHVLRCVQDLLDVICCLGWLYNQSLNWQSVLSLISRDFRGTTFYSAPAVVGAAALHCELPAGRL